MRTEDGALVARLARGDIAAAQEVYERHARALLRFAVALTDCIATAEDVVHDTFIQLLRHPRRYDAERGSLRAYLYGIARHQIARCLRAAGRYASHELYEESPGQAEPQNEPAESATAPAAPLIEDQIDRARARERIRSAIQALPLPYREVVALCELEELAYSMVADILQCPIGTVRSRLYRARALLAKSLAETREVTPPSAQLGGTDATASQEFSTSLTLALSVKGTST